MRFHVCLAGCLAIVLITPLRVRAGTIYFNDFDQPVGSEWSNRSEDVTPIGSRQFLGLFRNESVTLRLRSLPPHQSVRIEFDLFIIGTWDGSEAVRPGEGPDVWAVAVDGGLPLLRASFDNHYAPLYQRPARQSYSQGYGHGQHPAQAGAVERNTLGYCDPDYSELAQDAVYHLVFTFPHEANELSLSFSANCIDAVGGWPDETWGLDHVIVELPDVSGQAVLVASSSEGGTVLAPGQGDFWYAQGSVVQIKAKADPSYVFDRWSGPAVEQGRVADPFSAETSVQVDAACMLMANFVHDPGASVLVVDDAAAMDPGPGDPKVSDPHERGTFQHPFDCIQEAIDAFNPNQHKAILVLSGLYKGPGNRDIDLKGRRMRLYSSGGAGACIIDCEGQGRGFVVHAGEGPATVIDGFTIRSGAASEGAGIYSQASPTFSNCALSGNTATGHGGAVYCASGTLSLYDCTIGNCGDEGVYVADGATLKLGGLIQVDTTTLAGAGRVDIPTSAVLEMNHCGVTCDFTGSGWISAFGGFAIAAAAEVDLAQQDAQGPQISGTLSCQGLLHIQDQVKVYYANVETSSAVLEGRSVVSNCAICLQGPLVYGQFMVKDDVSLRDNLIKANSDNFLTFDSTFSGSLSGNSVELTLSGEQVLEVRGQNLACASGGVQTGTVPSIFDRSLWPLRVLELTDGALVTLADRFDDQQDGRPESLYVRTLRLGHNAELDCRNWCVQTETSQQDPTATITQIPLYGQSLGMLDFSDSAEFTARVQVTDPQTVNIVREAMCLAVRDEEPTVAKGRFDRCIERRLLIRFKYLFVASDAALRIYLSDSPQVGDRDPSHTHAVATIVPPPSGRPGSIGSSRYGQAELWADTAGLDLSRGTWVELELVHRPGTQQSALHSAASSASGSAGESASIDNWAVEIACSGVCMDLNQSLTSDEKDFEVVMCAAGRSASATSEAARCFEWAFSVDGLVDSMDLCSWEWMLSCGDCLNVCRWEPIPLSGATGGVTYSLVDAGRRWSSLVTMASGWPAGLTILDKLQTTSVFPRRVGFADRLHVANTDGTWNTYWLESAIAHGSFRLVRSNTGQVYVVNYDRGVTDRDDRQQIVAPQIKSIGVEPRYGQTATVAIGLQGRDAGTWGRPILDAVVEANAIYVVPVVVTPESQRPYLAAARLAWSGDRIERIYDDADPHITHSETLDNPNLNALREIEADAQGNVYLLNVHALNSSTILWKYAPTSEVLCRRELGTLGVVDPIGLCLVHSSDNLVYLANARNDPNDCEATTLYGLSADDLEVRRKVRIVGLHHVTGITEQGQTGVLWVVGYSLDRIAQRIDPMDLPKYYPCIAEVRPDDVEVACVADMEGGMVLPVSVVWTGQ